MTKKFRFFNKVFSKVEPYLQCYFYPIVLVGFVLVVYFELQDSISLFVHLLLAPLFALFVCMAFLTREKKPHEELFSFFLFPLFFSVVLQPILYFFTTDSTTSFVLQMLFLVPISNIAYVIILEERDRMSLKSLGHLVTAVQAILFVSTIIGFIIKNPFLFDGFLVNTKMADIGFGSVASLAKLSLSSVIEGLTQSFSIPYLFSATAIKGWVEYQNFKARY